MKKPYRDKKGRFAKKPRRARKIVGSLVAATDAGGSIKPLSTVRPGDLLIVDKRPYDPSELPIGAAPKCQDVVFQNLSRKPPYCLSCYRSDCDGGCVANIARPLRIDDSVIKVEKPKPSLFRRLWNWARGAA